MKRIFLPKGDVTDLVVGEWVLLNGTIYTARDQAHKRMVEEGIPLALEGQAIYYAGPCPAKPGQVSGPIGPTTSMRMDAFTPFLLKNGLKVMLGKGDRSPAVREAIKEYQAVYLVTVGGAGALIADKVKKLAVIAYDDLRSEAIHCLEIEDLPALVAIDSKGRSIFQK
jgi:fumarate hydratase subunit beta